VKNCPLLRVFSFHLHPSFLSRNLPFHTATFQVIRTNLHFLVHSLDTVRSLVCVVALTGLLVSGHYFRIGHDPIRVKLSQPLQVSVADTPHEKRWLINWLK